MKKLSTLLLALLLCLSCVATLVACDGEEPAETQAGTSAPAGTEAPAATEAPATEAPATEAPAETEAPATEAPAGGDETSGEVADGDYDPELYVVIRTAEDLMAFNKAVNEDGEYFDGMTVIFLDDIDLTGYVWTPLDGMGLFDVTFDGQGHTISNMEIATLEVELGTPADQIAAGFIGVSMGSLTFQDITFDNCHAVAYERHVGCLIGLNLNSSGGYLWFENVNVTNFTAEGWMDYNNQDPANDGHPISFRLAGFVGHNMAGSMGFESCKVENIKLTGFHNLAGFIGYESTGTVDEFCFENCEVNNAEFTFSYCLSDAYTIDQPRKFVSVFYNANNWADNLDYVVEMDNTFTNVSYFDWSDDNAEYDASEFRSWTREEAAV